MMRKANINFTLLLLFFILPFTLRAQVATQAHKDSLNTIVENYYELNKKVFQENSQVADIDIVFELFTDDFTYVHPKYGGTYSRKDLYDGYVRNQKNGAYNGSISDIKIVNQITGLNAVVVEKKFIMKTEEGDLEMTLFEFSDGKISRIYEYW